MAAWTDEESTRLTELHAAGKSLHFIANEMGRSKNTISKWASTLGLSWDRTETAKAAEAVHIDNKAKRAKAESLFLDKTIETLEQLDQPALVYSFGGPMNEYNEHILTKPDPIAQKHIMSAASTAINAAMKLGQLNSEGRDLPAVDAWLSAMTSGDGVE